MDNRPKIRNLYYENNQKLVKQCVESFSRMFNEFSLAPVFDIKCEPEFIYLTKNHLLEAATIADDEQPT